MSERYPDEYWLADFERRLNDGRLLMSEESLALIAELRRIRLERNELRAALEPFQIQLTQHGYTPRPDEWFYDVPEICDGGPCESQADALRTAVNHVRRRTIEQRQELDDMVQAHHDVRAKLDQTEDGDGLALWRRVFDNHRTYAVARLCANVACSNPANNVLGPARNCCMAGRMISSLVSNQLVPVVIR
jgi:hypothetical protein